MGIEDIIEELRLHQHRSSTRMNYYCVWRKFNEFYVRLDKKPRAWEQRILLFAAHISAIRAVLNSIDIKISEDTCLLNSLIRACKLTNDTVRIRMPIRKEVLNMVLRQTDLYFRSKGQIYLQHLYLALFSTAYFGLFRVSELTCSEHVVKACDVHIATNKKKLLFVLRSSRTQGKDKKPQLIKISNILSQEIRLDTNKPSFCPYSLLQNYLSKRKNFQDYKEQFFVFSDRTPVKANHFRNILKEMLTLCGFDKDNYGTHSLRAGKSVDLFHMGFSVDTIKKLGRWSSNLLIALQMV